MIQGNIQGVRASLLEELEKLYDAEFGREEFLPGRLLNLLARFTQQMNREIMVYLTREGGVLEVAVGSIASVGLPQRHLRRNWERLSGIRCIHTHPGGDARLSQVDEQALRLLRFDAMCAVGVADGLVTGISAAFLGDVEYGALSIITFGPVKPGRVPQRQWMREIELADERVARAVKSLDLVEQAEKALLISVDSQESLDELAALASTAGAVVMDRALQSRQKPDSATYIGSGKAQELALSIQAQEIDLVIVDDELTGAQQRNLEKLLGARVIDRTALILDIFAGRAQSREGKLQVELAQMKYRLPRLMGLGSALSRLGGGIGTRGPGETRLEVDRRRVRKRIDDLTGELAELSKQRQMRRARRKKGEQVTVALVGYTNAGKSTLLNALSGAQVLTEDKLFATLDPVVRKIALPENRECLLVDTVGFIRKLPHELVKAFRATLEEARLADVLIMVLDGADAQMEGRRRTVEEVLDSLGATEAPRVEAVNKCDLIASDAQFLPGALYISASTGENVEKLLLRVESELEAGAQEVRLLIPFSRYALVSRLHAMGGVLEQRHSEEGVEIRMRITPQNVKFACREGAKVLGGEKM